MNLLNMSAGTSGHPDALQRLLLGDEIGPIDFPCACGRRHFLPLEALVNRPGALEEVPTFLRRRDVAEVWLIADENTDAAAGARLRALLGRAGTRVVASVLPGKPAAHPDEQALGRLALDLQPTQGIILAVGAGTITDLARFWASRLGRPFIAVPTAPSVDGFTSSVAAMVVRGVRVTFPAKPPVAVFADPAVYAAAPSRLISAGWAELAGKWTALADWALSSILNDEYHCEVAAGLVAEAAQITRHLASRPLGAHDGGAAPALAWHTPDVVRRLMDGLLRVGVAMLTVGSSRPASGSEHHLAHYWEMKALANHEEPSLHGERVGVASVEIQRLYGRLMQLEPSAWPGYMPVDAERHEAMVRQRFGPLAPQLLAEQRTWPDGPWRLFGRTDSELAERRRQIQDRWDRVRLVARRYLDGPENVEAFLGEAGAPDSAGLLPEVEQPVAASMYAARELRPRYTILHLATEVGLLPV